ncbi:MAG: hypothetical protein JSV16_09500 [Candidatus Hydrogenedentota bacterium]|nr:MAG: hypothetical protein JSV16_09500 [Candidatus Hydrogenedentota bacterium]
MKGGGPGGLPPTPDMRGDLVAREYTHIELNVEVQSIGGRYVLEKEVRMPYHGEEVLYVVGTGVVDTSCCGMGGCRYAIVPGYVLDWKYRTDGHSRPVSEVEPIRDEEIREELRQCIMRDELVQLVDFH